MATYIGLATLLALPAIFYALTRLTKRRNCMSAEQVARIIERHLDPNQGPWDWEELTALPLHDERLEKIRRRCIELDSVPSFDRIPELKRILAELRSD